jgi:NADH-quinone oxidoreductase subunit F
VQPVLSRNFHHPEPLDLAAYKAAGGYASLSAAFARKPEDLIATVEEAGLRGCGGGGFPCGTKWRLRGMDAPRPRYLVCNLDESEQGTFKDRQLLYRDPHQIVEALIVSAFAQQAERAFVFVRGEYVEGARGLAQAVKEAEEAGFVGRNIQGTGFDLKIDVHLSSGRYICGDETAQLNSLEGLRANPRHKPPHPAVKGLWGQPTLVNNVETLCNVPHILLNGPDWYKSIGVNGGAGPKLYTVCGPVKRPGWWELPLGTTARELIYGHAGGPLDGRELVGFLPGGGSTPFLLADHLDTPMHWDGPPSAGSRLGTVGIIVMDDATCPVAFLANTTKFYARESCGFCTPCRDGLPFLEFVLQKIDSGQAEMSDLDLLEDLCRKIFPATFCSLAPGAIMPVQSGLECFREAFERHIREKRCPYQQKPG